MNNQFDILFEPVQIGPVTAPNRFYQVPHCNGLGYKMPKALAAMRGMKAQGGWGVVCTEETQIHHSSDQTPHIEGRFWDDKDMPAMQIMVEAVHEHGALAGLEIAYHGLDGCNLYSRVPSMSARSMALWGATGHEPGQSRRMDKEDIRNVRRWHREAAIRGKKAGFDIIYVYGDYIPWQFLSRYSNDRTDEYGGSLENRARLMRELLEDTKEAVGDRCAVALRFGVNSLAMEEDESSQSEGHDLVAMLADLPDLWDVNVAGWDNDSLTSRFGKEGHQEPIISFVKKLTNKPVVGVGRFTSPETMVSMIERGVLDLIGAARPSIADPFLPQKIREGRIEDIRECIGCNICVSSDFLFMPIRCTQNPTMGEEWRRGWHPEKIAQKKSDRKVLVVGGGPAGLECARALGARGYTVTLTEARNELGGRVLRESQLPNLIEWRRVMDWRLTQLEKMPNVEVYPGSKMQAEDVLETGLKDVIIATGARWRRDGIGRSHWQPIPSIDQNHVYTPDDIMEGHLPSGHVLLFDDEHFYMGGVLAEKLVEAGCTVTMITPESLISAYTKNTLEQAKVQARLLELGVTMHIQSTLQSIHADHAIFWQELRGKEIELACDAVVTVVDRQPNDELYQALKPSLASGILDSLRVIGDADAPHIIERAVFAGHLAAREFDEEPVEGTPFLIERHDYS